MLENFRVTTAVCRWLFNDAFWTVFTLSSFIASMHLRSVALGVVLSTLIDGSVALEQCNFTSNAAAGCWCVNSMGVGSCVASSGGYGYSYIGDIPVNSVLVGSKYYGNGCVLMNGIAFSAWGAPAINPCAGTITGFCKPGALTACCPNADCVNCDKVPENCFAARNFTDSDWNTLNTFFDIAGRQLHVYFHL